MTRLLVIELGDDCGRAFNIHPHLFPLQNLWLYQNWRTLRGNKVRLDDLQPTPMTAEDHTSLNNHFYCCLQRHDVDHACKRARATGRARRSKTPSSNALSPKSSPCAFEGSTLVDKETAAGPAAGEPTDGARRQARTPARRAATGDSNAHVRARGEGECVAEDTASHPLPVCIPDSKRDTGRRIGDLSDQAYHTSRNNNQRRISCLCQRSRPGLFFRPGMPHWGFQICVEHYGRNDGNYGQLCSLP
ncbi:hypothetical protein GGTG_13492 [Gaeumannomyces tritici R3-111a-1]|uniref:Uncharacterized protein n=1 Tax=Gaeumannomyces tritici (strain R3-111a-1) TaxID=644352 RepID=J3PJ10_GAET3|nr:hypothetical protein GGTG_13492 [Gaeumannomyces tritici R3-111a-1]EJT68986.1 hypothetical protein GGTG_13492 [Gaeumannomyces tritici R3-111a-1]